MNMVRTGLLLAALTGLFLAAGYLLGGSGGATIAFLIALAMNFFAWWSSDTMVLRMHGAQPVTPASAPDLYALVQQLAANAGLPTPTIYLIHSDQPNAFATGRSPERSAVAVTTGILRALDREELAGVIAHELAHIRNRDTLTMTMAATIAGAIGFLANFGFFFAGSSDNRQNPLGPIGAILVMILAPLAAMLVQLAISRTREYSADRAGGRDLRPPALARPGPCQDRAAGRGPRDAECGGQPGQRAPLHRQPAPHGRRGRPVPHPPRDREADRSAAGAGRQPAGRGPAGWSVGPVEPLGLSSA